MTQQTLPDVSNLDIEHLHALRSAIDLLIEQKQETGRDELLDRLAQEASQLGFDSVQALIDGKPTKSRKIKERGNGAKNAKSQHASTAQTTEVTHE